MRDLWNQVEDDVIRAMVAQGSSFVEVGRRLCRSPKAVARRAQTIGVARKVEQLRWPPELDAQIRRLGDQGFTGREIATAMGMSYGRVKDRLAELRVATRRVNIWRGPRATPDRPRAATFGSASGRQPTKVKIPAATLEAVERLDVAADELFDERAEGVPYLDRTARQCPWPLWNGHFDPRTSCCCGRPRMMASEVIPYCEEHLRVALSPEALRRLRVVP